MDTINRHDTWIGRLHHSLSTGQGAHITARASLHPLACYSVPGRYLTLRAKAGLVHRSLIVPVCYGRYDKHRGVLADCQLHEWFVYMAKQLTANLG